MVGARGPVVGAVFGARTPDPVLSARCPRSEHLVCHYSTRHQMHKCCTLRYLHSSVRSCCSRDVRRGTAYLTSRHLRRVITPRSPTELIVVQEYIHQHFRIPPQVSLNVGAIVAAAYSFSNRAAVQTGAPAHLCGQDEKLSRSFMQQ